MSAGAACSTVGAGPACVAMESAYIAGVHGGSLAQMLEAGAIAGATAEANVGIGDVTGSPGAANYFENVGLHAALGCVSTAASGGQCGAGALAGGVSAAAAPAVNQLGLDGAGALAAHAVLGGFASVAGGGKFANGALTGAFDYLFSGGGGDGSGGPISQGTGGVAFVGGFFDYTIGGPAYADYQAYINDPNNPGRSAAYFTWDQGGALGSWIDANGGAASVIGHSYGGDTAASVVAAGHSVASLTTVDPVSWFRPNYAAVAANILPGGSWTNLNATAGQGSLPNILAGIGGAWGTGSRGYATRFQNVPLDHAGIMYRCGLPGSC